MIMTKHFKERMRQRNISSFMVEILLKLGEFNENCQRLIINIQQKELLNDFKEKLKIECQQTKKCLDNLESDLKKESNELLKQFLVIERRDLKKTINCLHKKQKDLEKISNKKHTLVLENDTLITVF